MTTKDGPIDRGLSSEDVRLDRLLKAARPPRDAAREAALLDRIMASAGKAPRVVARTARPDAVTALRVVPVAPAAAPDAAALNAETAAPLARPVAQPPERQPARSTVQRSRRETWAASSLLAASLIVGLIAGQLSYTSETLTRLEQVTGLTLASASDEIDRTFATFDGEDDDL